MTKICVIDIKEKNFQISSYMCLGQSLAKIILLNPRCGCNPKWPKPDNNDIDIG